MFPQFPTLRCRVSHAEERLRYQRFVLHAGERLRNQRHSHAGERLRYQRLSHERERLRDQRLSDNQSSPACHGQTAGRCVGVLGLRIVVQDVAASLGLAVAAAAMPLEFDVAASLWPAVAAATVRLEFDVAASLWPAVAAAAISTKDDADSWPPTVAAAAHSERAPARDLSAPLATQSQTPSR